MVQNLSNYSDELAIVITNPNKKIIWINDGFTSLTGYQMQEAYGKSPSMLQGVDTKEEVVECMRKLLALEIPFTETISNYRKDGSHYNCILTIHPIFNLNNELIAFLALEGEKEILSDENMQSLLKKPKYSSSNLSKVKSIKIYKELMMLFREERIFMNQKCSLPLLSEKLQTNTKYLSQVINNETGKNFRELLNTYRINHFKTLVKMGEHLNYSIEGLASKCGFKNQMSFYNAVKKQTQFSPRQLINHINS